MRVLDWNIEWMNNWFVGGNQVAWRSTHDGISDVQALAQRVANVITTLEPDVLIIQEGPSDSREMQLFIDDFLTDGNRPLYDQFGGLDGGAQKTYILVKNNGQLEEPRLATDELTAGLFEEWLADVDGDLRLEAYEFTRQPLVVDGTLSASGQRVRFVNLHTKSKFVNNQQAMWNDPARRPEFISAAMKNRRRISTEAMRVRTYLDELVKADGEALVLVAGDFNDGPGLDYFERQYLTHGVANIILGSLYYPDRQFPHALIGRVPADQLYTAVFDDFIDEIPNRPLLLDHVLVSPPLRHRIHSARICRQEYQAQEDLDRPPAARDRLPSDHCPILVEVL